MTKTETNTALTQLIVELYSIIQTGRAAAEDALDACALAEAQLDEVARVVMPDAAQARPTPAPPALGAVYDNMAALEAPVEVTGRG